MVLGGFTGTENSADERDPSLHETILSGDIGIPANDSDNSLRVVAVESNVLASTILDGFTITLGRAVNNGAGIRIADGDPTIIGCLFVDNAAPTSDGGGAHSFSAFPTFIDCTFLNNSAGGRGDIL